MSMDIDHYYTQRDTISSPRPAPRHAVSAPSTPARGPSAGKIRIPPPTSARKNVNLHREIFGSDDEYEDGQVDAERFLDSLDLDPHSMIVPIPHPRKIAGSRRVASAQGVNRLQNQEGWKLGGGSGGGLNPDAYVNPVPPPAPQVFQSITATPQLGERSFEELRADCYGQSYIARGAPPPPSIPQSVDVFGVLQPARCIPPAFQPRIVANQLDSMAYPTDVVMYDA